MKTYLGQSCLRISFSINTQFALYKFRLEGFWVLRIGCSSSGAFDQYMDNCIMLWSKTSISVTLTLWIMSISFGKQRFGMAIATVGCINSLFRERNIGKLEQRLALCLLLVFQSRKHLPLESFSHWRKRYTNVLFLISENLYLVLSYVYFCIPNIRSKMHLNKFYAHSLIAWSKVSQEREFLL